ncbi:hypothetical protein Rsub_12359 [Raphidocelis subcapitata]|uniref:RNA-binding S4 domain-containing protein n=1 Tax=Raphidocelis subcapitata TaxID=307507 RepID=A0A2V0PNA0_9CHLO|nr:hypothetical protein Rsub_12359 [Raphidocelis subcapitata]|eukprot:GBF99553.1 hypothetical protein Rsub_12359 [Raphidocelis subcapitata]
MLDTCHAAAGAAAQRPPGWGPVMQRRRAPPRPPPPRALPRPPPNFDPPVGKRERVPQRTPTSQPRPQPASSEQRLAKVLAAAGVASRRKVEDLIAEGRVAVNGQVVSVQGFRVLPAQDSVTVDGREVRLTALPPPRGRGGARAEAGGGGGGGGAGGGEAPVHRPYYFALHKPAGCICSNTSSRPGGRVVDLFEPWVAAWRRRERDPSRLPPRLFTAGRLDVATTGLVFVTNDGAWSNRVIHPSAGLTKEYLATVARPPTAQQLAALRRGTEVDGVMCVPKVAEVVSAGPGSANGASGSGRGGGRGGGGGGGGAGSGGSGTAPAAGRGAALRDSGAAAPRGGAVLRIVVSEGKRHEVRLIVAAAGLELRALHRTRVGGYRMPAGLARGAYTELDAGQAEAVLRDAL